MARIKNIDVDGLTKAMRIKIPVACFELNMSQQMSNSYVNRENWIKTKFKLMFQYVSYVALYVNCLQRKI